MAHAPAFKTIARNSGGLGVYIIARSRPGHAHEYFEGGGIVKRRQRWGTHPEHAFRFKSREKANALQLRLKDWAARVDDLRSIVTDDE
jgi:hypothetical protein